MTMKMNYKKGTLILTFIGMVFSFSSCKNGQTINPKEHSLNEVNKVFNSGGSSINKDYVKSLQDFSVDFAKYVYEGENTIYSPISIATCFSMLLDGCNNESKKELETLLHYDASFSHLDEIKNMLLSTAIDTVEEKDKSCNSFLDINQSFFVHNQYKDHLKEDYINTLTNYYFAEAYQGVLSSDEMHDLLAKWINDKTNNFFNLKGKDFDDLAGVLWLVNTIYMESKWASMFSEYAGKDNLFTNLNGKETEAKYITSYEEGFVFKHDDYMIRTIPLRDRLYLRILLPNDLKKCNEIFLNKDAYVNLLNPTKDNLKIVDARITYKIPEFKQISDFDLVTVFKKMGVKNIFSPKDADLSGISYTALEDQLHVSSALHSAGIDVNKDGVEAAAYTIIEADATSPMPEEKEDINFFVERPFMYTLGYDDNLPLFVGIQTSL